MDFDSSVRNLIRVARAVSDAATGGMGAQWMAILALRAALDDVEAAGVEAALKEMKARDE